MTFHAKSAFSSMERKHIWSVLMEAEPIETIQDRHSIWQLNQSVTLIIPQSPKQKKDKVCFPVETTTGPYVLLVNNLILQVGTQKSLVCDICKIADIIVAALLGIPCLTTIVKRVPFHTILSFSIMENCFECLAMQFSPLEEFSTLRAFGS